MKPALRYDHTRITYLFSVLAIAIIVAAWAASRLYHELVDAVQVHGEIFLSAYRNQIRPESDERFVFIFLCISIPIVCFAACAVIFRKRTTVSYAPIYGFFLDICVALAILVPMAGFEFTSWLRDDRHVAPWSTAILFSLFVATVAWYRVAAPSRLSRSNSVIGYAIFLSGMVLQISSFRLISVNSVFDYPAWNVHFDAVIYTVSQVVGGKTLLADLPSQYGMYPEILAPLFRVTGLSTMSFTAVCAVLQILSMSSLWWVMHRCVRDNALKILGSIALLMTTFETVMFLIGVNEPYFQYWPIRFVWPALSVLMFYFYSRSRTLRRGACVSLIGMMGAIWNADSGLMIVMAFGAFICFKLTGGYLQGSHDKQQLRHLWGTLGVHIAVNLCGPALFFLILALKADAPLHFSWLYQYQVNFYKLGFMMLPMPTHPSAWMTVMGAYVIGITCGFVGVVRGRNAWKLENILYVSLLGVGIFVYYQGRSHILNLITVSWPSILVGCMLADRVLRAVRTGTSGYSQIALPAAVLALMAYCAVPFLVGVPKLYDAAAFRFLHRNETASAVVMDDIDFIRKHSRPNEVCAILATRQGIYYAETGLVSPLKGPGYIETVLQVDQDSMSDQIGTLKPGCLYLGMGASTLAANANLNEVLKEYIVVAVNDSGTMQYLTPRP